MRRFQTDPRCWVAILSLLAASQGITLTAADTIVFAELHWTPGLIEQAEDCAHRIGQPSAVNVHYLVAQGTLDTMMWGLISKKVFTVSKALDGTGHRLKAPRVQAEPSSGKAADPENPEDPAGLVEAAARWAAEARPSGRFARNDVRSFFAGAGRSTSAGADLTPWACGACTFLNKPSGVSGDRVLGASSCSVCGTPRARPVAKAAAAGGPQKRVVAGTMNYTVSAHTGRIHLHGADGTPLNCNITPDEVRIGRFDALPAALRANEEQLAAELQHFVRCWDGLRVGPCWRRDHAQRAHPSVQAIDQRQLENVTIAEATVDAAKAAQQRQRQQRPTPAKVGGTASTLCNTPRPPTVTPVRTPVKRHAEETPSVGDARRAVVAAIRRVGRQGVEPAPPPAAAAVATAPVPDGTCWGCRKAMPPLPWERREDGSSAGKEQFCSHDCWTAYSVKIGRDVRRRLLELEKGVCQLCGFDTRKLYESLRALEGEGDTDARRELLAGTPFARLPLAAFTKLVKGPVAAGSLWQADHILAVCEGVGECDLENYRPCAPSATRVRRPSSPRASGRWSWRWRHKGRRTYGLSLEGNDGWPTPLLAGCGGGGGANGRPYD